MKYSANVIAFQSRVKSAMRDDLAWDMLELMSDNLCINVKVSKEVVHVLLQELKIYKLTNPCYLDSKAETGSESIDIKIEVQEDLVESTFFLNDIRTIQRLQENEMIAEFGPQINDIVPFNPVIPNDTEGFELNVLGT